MLVLRGVGSGAEIEFNEVETQKELKRYRLC